MTDRLNAVYSFPTQDKTTVQGTNQVKAHLEVPYARINPWIWMVLN